MRHSIALLLFAAVGCGGSTPKAEEPKSEPAAASAAPAEGAAAAADQANAEEDSKKIPDACAGGNTDACVMPRGFVKRLCSGAYPELALYFFQKDTPWRRAYVAVKEVRPFNGFNGPSAEEKLVFEEEVLVLGEKKVDTGGMQVSGASGSVDVLRWDGTCATLSSEEVRFSPAPPSPKHATIQWRFLEDATQDALKKNEALEKIVIERKKECKGATMGSVSAKCEKADKALNDLVVKAVRTGTTVPLPAKVP